MQIFANIWRVWVVGFFKSQGWKVSGIESERWQNARWLGK